MAKKVVEPIAEEVAPEVVPEETPVTEGFDDFFAAALKDPEEVKPEPVAEKEPEVIPEEVKPEVVPEEVKPEVVPEVKEDPRIAALEKQIADLQASQKKPVEEVRPEGPTEEEKKAVAEAGAKLAQFEKDWPDHAEAMKANQQLILSEVEKVFKNIVAPLFQQLPALQTAVNETAEERAINTVKAVHPDCIEIIPEIEKWIPTLPGYMQVAANQVLDKGTPADVIDLMNAFKSATGRVKEAVVAPVIKPENNPRVASLVSPKSSRTGMTVAEDPTDFDSAFSQALKVV
jgi:hypothetical protein